MIGKGIVPALALILSMAFMAPVLVWTPHEAFAKSKEPAASKQPSVSKKLFKPLSEAGALLKEEKWQEALAKLAEAEAIEGRSDDENYFIDVYKAQAYIGLKDPINAAPALERALSSSSITPEDRGEQQKMLAQLYIDAKNYPKALSVLNAYLKDHPDDATIKSIVAQLSGDDSGVAKAAEDEVRAAEQAGKVPSEAALQNLMSNQYKAGKKAEYNATLEKLVRHYPRPEYWSDLIMAHAGRPSVSQQVRLDYYRLQMAVNALSRAGDYTAIAQTALNQGYPGEAKSVLEKGLTAGVLDGKAKSMLNEASQKAGADQKTLPQQESMAAAAKDGQRDVNLGKAYLSYGQPQKAIAALQRGLSKGVTDVNEARLHLGRAYVLTNQKDKAKQTFGAIGGGERADVAKLWLLYLGQGQA